MGLLFLHGMALASWFVPLGSVLDSADLGSIKPLAFAASAIAALLSPLFFGAMADRMFHPAKVLRGISIATAVAVCLIAWAIQCKVAGWIVLIMIQVQAFFCSPTSSLAGAIVFSQLDRSKRSFGSIRCLGTIGWMAGCWTVSILGLDSSLSSFVVSGFLWVLLAVFTLLIPKQSAFEASLRRPTLRERFGWDALGLLRNHDHRVVFTTSALISIPFAAFYPFTPSHLDSLGMTRISAWMSLGQVTEVAALICIAGILQRWSFKSVVTLGIGFGVLRYALYATNSAIPVLVGLALHGLAFTFTYISTQMYLAERIDPSWRTRAQALLSMMTAGFGNLTGYLWCGAWSTMCKQDGVVQWTVYWSGLAALVMIVLVYFSVSYHGTSSKAD